MSELERLKERLHFLCGGGPCQTLHFECSTQGADNNSTNEYYVGLVLEYASWNGPCKNQASQVHDFLKDATRHAFDGLDVSTFYACVQVDESDDTLRHCIGDDDSQKTTSATEITTSFSRPVPPNSFPAVALVMFHHDNVVDWRYVQNLASSDLLRLLSKKRTIIQTADVSHEMDSSDEQRIFRSIGIAADRFADNFHLPVQPEVAAKPLRVFVAGDRSSVGKSSVCLGILGNLLQLHSPDCLAYVKPATQSESTQLIQLFCERHNITCVPIGPLVYYRGFTRAFLAGETESTEQLLEQVGRAVDRVARNKHVVLIDGVGFPAVGSICGTDNASVAKACSYPRTSTTTTTTTTTMATITSTPPRKPMGVLLVGGSGVGGAVDAFNLNATYFDQAKLPVMGAIFNKLSETGYYSLENCRKEVTAYFNTNEMQQRLGRVPFGFVPLFPALSEKNAIDRVDEFIRMFGSHVNVAGIIQAAERIRQDESFENIPESSGVTNGVRPNKRQKINANIGRGGSVRSRAEIESQAIVSGAAPSA